MQAKGATLVSVTSVPGCRLEAVCDLAVVLPLVHILWLYLLVSFRRPPCDSATCSV